MKVVVITGPEISGDEPTTVHRTIAKFGCPVITTNTDGFHQEAGSKEVIELRKPGRTEVFNAGPALDLIKGLEAEDRIMVIGAVTDDMVRQIVSEGLKRGHMIITVDDKYEQRVPAVLRSEYREGLADG